MKNIIVLGLFIILISCSNRFKSKDNLNGLWIPDSVNWKNASFESILIFDDTSFVKIASTNILLKNDTLQLMTEPGFVLSSGIIKDLNHNMKTISYRTLYRYIQIEGEKIPSEIINDTLKVDRGKDSLLLYYSNKLYRRTNKISKESQERLKSLVDTFLPELKQRFNVSTDEMVKAGYGGGTRNYFRFGQHNTIYNIYDAGQFMWGRTLGHSGFSLSSGLRGPRSLGYE